MHLPPSWLQVRYEFSKALPIKEVRMPESASILRVLVIVNLWNYILPTKNSRNTGFKLLANLQYICSEEVLARRQCFHESGSQIRMLFL